MMKASLAAIGTALYCSMATMAAAQTAIDTRAAVENVAALVEGNFYDAERAGEIAAELRARSSAGEFDRLENPADLASALTGVLQPHDGHFNVVWTPPGQSAGASTDMEGAAMRFFTASERSNYGFREVEVLPGRVGYLRLDHFAMVDAADQSDPARRAADAALALIANTQAIIVDLRDNGGGAPPMVSYLASYFVPADADIFNTFHSRMGEMSEAPQGDPTGARRLDTPLYVLVSGRTASAAESFAYTLQAAGRAVVVGEATAGGANPGAFLSTPDGLSVFVSRGSPVNPLTGTNWEGEGVRPDVATPQHGALRAAQILALEAIAHQQQDEDARTESAWTLEALRNEPLRLTERAMRSYVGRYGQRSIEIIDGRLALRHDRRPPAILVAVAPDVFRVESNPLLRVQFERDERGAIAALVQRYTNAADARHLRS